MPPTNPDCLFCRLIDGNESAHVVHSDEHTLAFLDIRPLFHGHTLLVPREHHVTLEDLPGELVAPLFSTAQRLSVAVRNAMGAQGTFVAMNNVVSQSVPHLHVHIVPRVPKDGLRGFFWPRKKYKSDEQAAGVAAEIAELLR